MTTNKFIVERTVVGDTNTVLADTYGDVAGLNWYVNAGEVYEFKAVVVYDASATNEGASFAINGPTATVKSYVVTVPSGATPTTSYANAYDLPAAAASDSAFTTDNIAIIEGVVSPSADGTVSVRGIKSGGTVTVQGTSSYLTWKRIDWPAQP
jgi:hypothetical protein